MTNTIQTKNTTFKNATSKTKNKTKTKTKNLSVDSSYGMATAVWGPLFWSFITDVSSVFDYYWKSWEQKTKIKQMRFWDIIGHILPCHFCRESYAVFHKNPVPSYPFVSWVWNLHNLVNKKLEKPLHDISTFKRKVQTWSSFSNANTLQDIHFMLALNYSKKTKKKSYQDWFEWLSDFLPFLIRHKLNNSTHVQCYLSFRPHYLDSKITLLNWLTSCHQDQVPSEHQKKFSLVEYFILKYAKAIAHKDIKELALICGNLLTKCKDSRYYNCKSKKKEQ